ncbi:hypothetical protein AB0B56_00035 [Streptosporangium canum]|uniref:hypothetical protein n=1 Tax=Streptosporangium canum TaxID=324952 RepID=UPI00342F168A
MTSRDPTEGAEMFVSVAERVRRSLDGSSPGGADGRPDPTGELPHGRAGDRDAAGRTREGERAALAGLDDTEHCRRITDVH